MCSPCTRLPIGEQHDASSYCLMGHYRGGGGTLALGAVAAALLALSSATSLHIKHTPSNAPTPYTYDIAVTKTPTQGRQLLSDEVLLASYLDGTVSALDAATGERMWTLSTGAPMVSSTQPHLSEESSQPAVIPGRDGSIFVSSASGMHQLPYRTQELVAQLPLTMGSTVLLGSKKTTMLEVSLSTGAILRSLSSADPLCPAPGDAQNQRQQQQQHGAPFVGAPTIWIGRSDYEVHAYDSTRQRELWNLTYSQLTSPQLASLGDDAVAVATGAGRVQRPAGPGRGTAENGGAFSGAQPPVLELAATMAGGLAAVDASTGLLQWHSSSDALAPSPLVGVHLLALGGALSSPPGRGPGLGATPIDYDEAGSRYDYSVDDGALGDSLDDGGAAGLAGLRITQMPFVEVWPSLAPPSSPHPPRDSSSSSAADRYSERDDSSGGPGFTLQRGGRSPSSPAAADLFVGVLGNGQVYALPWSRATILAEVRPGGNSKLGGAREGNKGAPLTSVDVALQALLEGEYGAGGRPHAAAQQARRWIGDGSDGDAELVDGDPGTRGAGAMAVVVAGDPGIGPGPYPPYFCDPAGSGGAGRRTACPLGLRNLSSPSAAAGVAAYGAGGLLLGGEGEGSDGLQGFAAALSAAAAAAAGARAASSGGGGVTGPALAAPLLRSFGLLLPRGGAEALQRTVHWALGAILGGAAAAQPYEAAVAAALAWAELAAVALLSLGLGASAPAVLRVVRAVTRRADAARDVAAAVAAAAAAEAVLLQQQQQEALQRRLSSASAAGDGGGPAPLPPSPVRQRRRVGVLSSPHHASSPSSQSPLSQSPSPEGEAEGDPTRSSSAGAGEGTGPGDRPAAAAASKAGLVPLAPPSPFPAAPALPTTLVRDGVQYRVIGRLALTDRALGYGCHGTVVYAGLFDSRPVAVKRMLRAFFPEASREISLLIRTDGHPNVVRYHACEEAADFVYLALELCEMSLADAVARMAREKGRLGAASPHTRRFLHELVCGVAHLHAHRIVHRDLKPHNVLIARHGAPGRPADAGGSGGGMGDLEGCSPKISDFGLGKQLAADASSFGGVGIAPGPGSTSFVAQQLVLRAAGRRPGAGERGLLDAAGGDPGVGAAASSSIAAGAPGSVGWQAPELLATALRLRGFQDASAALLPSAGGQAVSDGAEEEGGPSGANTSNTNTSSSSGGGAPADPAWRLSRAADVWALGCVLHHTLTLTHPFGDNTYERESNILHGRALGMPALRPAPDAHALVSDMLAVDPAKRPTAAQAAEHPFFWPDERRLAFLGDLSDRLERECSTNNSAGGASGGAAPPAPPTPLYAAVEARGAAWGELPPATDPTAPGGRPGFGSAKTWTRRLPPSLLQEMTRFRRYDGESLVDCLRFVRNTRSHVGDLPAPLRGELLGAAAASPAAALAPFFLARFPGLLLAAHAIACEWLAHEAPMAAHLGPVTAGLCAPGARRRASEATAAAAAVAAQPAAPAPSSPGPLRAGNSPWRASPGPGTSSRTAPTSRTPVRRAPPALGAAPSPAVTTRSWFLPLPQWGAEVGAQCARVAEDVGGPRVSATMDAGYAGPPTVQVTCGYERVAETSFRGGAHTTHPRYKCAPCKDWECNDGRFCPRGARCDFAHGALELRGAAPPLRQGAQELAAAGGRFAAATGQGR